MSSARDASLAILDFLGIPHNVIEVDLELRINALPTVRILRYVDPQEILGEGDDRHLKTEEVRFTLTRIEEPPP